MTEFDKIIEFDMKTILDSIDINKYKKGNAYFADEPIIISEEVCNCARRIAEKTSKSDDNYNKKMHLDKISCHMFKQLDIALAEKGIEKYELNEIFFIMNFKKCEEAEYKKLQVLKERFAITINGRITEVREFLKSSSMSRDCRMYYIDKNYYSVLNSRLTFDLIKNENDKVKLSKWFAYTGLVISDCFILNDIQLNKDEVAIVPDKEVYFTFENCLTAISIPSLLQDVDKIRIELKKNAYGIDGIVEKFYSYRSSNDFESLPKAFKDIINKVILYKSLDDEKYIASLDNLFYTYNEEYVSNEIEWKKLRVNKLKTKLNYYDGEGLISMELRDSINIELAKYRKNKTQKLENNSFQIRLPFIKGVVHSCDFKSFFKEHGVNKIVGRDYVIKDNELTCTDREYDIDKLKMILTESQFKLIKFENQFKNIVEPGESLVDAYFRLLNKYEYSLGISKLEHENKDSYVRLNYQFFSTMPLDEISVKKIGASNKRHLAIEASPDEIINNISGRAESDNGLKAMVEAYKISPSFVVRTKLFKNQRDKVLYNERVNACTCRINVEGARKFLSGDLLGLLYHIIDEPIPDNEKLRMNSLYMPDENYKYTNTPLALLRNPHYSRNEIKMLTPLKPKEYSERYRYFSHLKGVVMQNPMSDTAERLGGADYDGDEVIVCWDRGVINPLFHNLYKDSREIYPLVKIPSIDCNPNNFNYENIINNLKNTFNSRVGQISNECFIKSFEYYAQDMPDEVAFYTILNGLEIDSAKNGRKPKMNFENYSKLSSSRFYKFIKLKEDIGKYNSRENKYNCIFSNNKIKKNLDDLKEYSDTFFKVVGLNSMNLSGIKIEDSKAEDNKKSMRLQANLSAEDMQSIIAMGISYELIVKVLDNYFTEKKFDDNTNVIRSFANEIMLKNGASFDMDKMVESFKDNADYTKILKEYVLDKPYYLQEDNDKLKALADLGQEDLPEEIKKALINYDNYGFELLYLALYYLREINKDLDYYIELSYENINDEKSDYEKIFNNALYSIDNIADYKDSIYNQVQVIINELKDIIASGINENFKIKEIEESIYEYFINKTQKYTMEEIGSVIKYKDTTMTFNVFGKQLISYLKGGKLNG